MNHTLLKESCKNYVLLKIILWSNLTIYIFVKVMPLFQSLHSSANAFHVTWISDVFLSLAALTSRPQEQVNTRVRHS